MKRVEPVTETPTEEISTHSLSVKVTDDVWYQFRLACAKTKQKQKDVLNRLIDEFITKSGAREI